MAQTPRQHELKARLKGISEARERVRAAKEALQESESDLSTRMQEMGEFFERHDVLLTRDFRDMESLVDLLMDLA